MKNQKKILESYHLTLDESLENKIIERMNEIQNKQVLSIKKYLSESIVIPDFKYYKIRGRSVVLDPSYKEALEEHFSLYADSEGRKAALEAFYKVQEAVEEFEHIVITAPKRDLTQEERLIKADKYSCGARIFPDDLGGLRAVGSKVPSIARLDLDGYLLLDGSAFSNLK